METPTEIKILENGKIELISGPFSPDIRDVANMVKEELTEKFSPLEKNEFLRFTNNKKEISLIKDKTIRVSQNWNTGEAEIGLSVSRHGGYSIDGYKHGYKIKGEIIGWGSDSEPLLDLNKKIKCSKMMTAVKLGDEYLRGYNIKMENFGWTHDFLTAATSSIKLFE